MVVNGFFYYLLTIMDNDNDSELVFDSLHADEDDKYDVVFTHIENKSDDRDMNGKANRRRRKRVLGEMRPAFQFSVLITTSFPSGAQRHMRELCYQAAQRGIYIDVGSWEKEGPMPRSRFLSMLGANNYAGLICTANEAIDPPVLAIARSLCVISSMTTQCRHVDLETCKSSNIIVGHLPTSLYISATAELAFALIQSVMNYENLSNMTINDESIEDMDQNSNKRRFEETKSLLDSMKVGLISNKETALVQAVVDRIERYGCSVKLIHPGDLKESLDDIDCLLPLCRLTQQTHGIFNSEIFEMMKDTAIFINIMSYDLMNPKDLYNALKNGTIKAAGLDMGEDDAAIQETGLQSLKNCVLNPSLAHLSYRTQVECATTAFDNLIVGLYQLTKRRSTKHIEKLVDPSIQKISPFDDDGSWLPKVSYFTDNN